MRLEDLPTSSLHGAGWMWEGGGCSPILEGSTGIPNHLQSSTHVLFSGGFRASQACKHRLPRAPPSTHWATRQVQETWQHRHLRREGERSIESVIHMEDNGKQPFWGVYKGMPLASFNMKISLMGDKSWG